MCGIAGIVASDAPSHKTALPAKVASLRDRIGEKPFYYAIGTRGEFVFASEIKAILATGLVRPRLSRQGVAHYLQHLYVHPDRTIYENVHVLPPAHCLTFRNDVLTVQRYWDIPTVRPTIGMSEAVEERWRGDWVIPAPSSWTR